MSNNNNNKSGKIEFTSYHQPKLLDGDYEMAVTHKTNLQALPFKAATQYFSVNGPRFELPPKDVKSVFPPDKSLGEYDTVLPHIMFNRSTLPWERTIDGKSTANAKTVQPWLALLLFDQSEINEGKTIDLSKVSSKVITVAELLKPTEPSPPEFPKIKKELAQSNDDKLTVIDVPKSLLWQVMPSREELAMMAHIREGVGTDGLPNTPEYPVIFSSRLPKPSSESVMHLVSLESRANLLSEFASGGPTSGRVRLVSLKSWTFASIANKKLFAGGLLDAWKQDGQDVQPTKDHLFRMSSVGRPKSAKYLEQGFVPSKHLTRQGNNVVSWYRGPLVPGDNADIELDGLLPAKVSDQLVRYDSTTSMFDVSLSAAWELGRLLTLQTKSIAIKLFNWKRAHAHASKQTSSNLPLGTTGQVPPSFPGAITNWFNELSLLEHIPFNYLVPKGEMLPAESVRFFKLDSNWITALLDGAYSLGRVLNSDFKNDKANYEAVVPTPGVMSGFLLRSSVVAGWPHLAVAGYTKPPADPMGLEPEYEQAIVQSINTSPALLDALNNHDTSSILDNFIDLDHSSIDIHALSSWDINEKSGHSLYRIEHNLDGFDVYQMPAKKKISSKISNINIQKALHSKDLSEVLSVFSLTVPHPATTTITQEPNTAWLVNADNNTNFYQIRSENGQLNLYVENELPLIRMERLSNNILLCIFAGELNTLDIHEQPEALHYGLTERKPGQYVKFLRSQKTGIQNKRVTPIAWKTGGDATKRVVNISTLARKSPNAADFGIAMMAGVGQVRFEAS